MYDAGCRCDAPTLQRAVGELRVSVEQRNGDSVLADLRQAGA